jgi:hypothetical protein
MEAAVQVPLNCCNVFIKLHGVTYQEIVIPIIIIIIIIIIISHQELAIKCGLPTGPPMPYYKYEPQSILENSN